MDPRLLRYYEDELQYIRKMGAEYAEEYPKIAARLSLQGLECADPYVERLLEGFAFLAARVHLKLDAEYPRIAQHLLEIVCPHYLAPTPSMAVVQLQPSLSEGALAAGFVVPRGTALRSARRGAEAEPCEYRTAQDVTLWPVEIVEASYGPSTREWAGTGRAGGAAARAVLRLRLHATAGLTFDQIALDHLVLYLRGGGDIPWRLHEEILAAGVGVVLQPGRQNRPPVALAGSSIRRRGFGDEEAVLPHGARSFQGYRLLQEYFAFPERFLFVELGGLRQALAGVNEPEVEVGVLLSRYDAALQSVVDASNVALYCTPAVNLFPMQADTIHLSEAQTEYHVVADRSRSIDYEIYDVLQVEGTGSSGARPQRFVPFYGSPERQSASPELAYFTTYRQPRRLSERERHRGARSNYVGSEVFLQIVDAREAPFRSDLRQLALKVRCTNRDLPLHLVTGQGRTDFTLQIGAPVEAVRCVSGPSAPAPSFAEGEIGWRLINHLSLNYLSLVDTSAEQGAGALREILSLYDPVASPSTRKQIDGVRTIASRPIVRRIHGAGPIAFGRGVEIRVTVDESAFTGVGAFLLGAVLDEFFARYVSINSFTQTVIASVDRAELMRWPPRSGRRHVL